MNNRFLRLATGLLVVAVMVLTADRCAAIYYGLGPSKDEWGLKYDVEVNDADADMVTVVFTLANEGRMKPIYSIELVAFSKQTDSQGGRSYDLKAPIVLKAAADGKRVGEVKIRKDLVDRAKFRLLTHMIDGKQQPSGGAYYDIPLKKFTNLGGEATPPVANRPRATAK